MKDKNLYQIPFGYTANSKIKWSDKPCLRCEKYFKKSKINEKNRSCDICNEFIKRNNMGE